MVTKRALSELYVQYVCLCVWWYVPHFAAIQIVELLSLTNNFVLTKNLSSKNQVMPAVSLYMCNDLYICTDLEFS